MAAALVAYVLLHSPLRDPLVALFGLERRTCYFCLSALTGFDLGDSLSAGTLIVVAAVAAWVLAARCSWPAYDRVLAFGIAAIALLTVPAATIAGMASLLGGSFLRPPAGPLLAAIPALAVIAWNLKGGWRPLPSPPRGPLLDTPLLWTVAGAAALLVVAEVAVTLLHPPSQGDALTYHAPLAVLFWSDGDLTSVLERSPDTWGLANPGTAELWYGALQLLGGERLANLGQLPFAFLGAAAVYAFTRRTGLLRGAAALAAAAFFLVPLVALQLGTQANDLAGAALLMAAIALASAPAGEWRVERAAAVGLALGLAAATKVALLPSVAAVAVFVVAMLAVRRRNARVPPWPAVAALALGLLVAVAPWWVRNIVREGNPIFPQSIPVYGHGVDLGAGIDLDYDFVERRVAWPVYPLVEPIDDRSGFGALLAIAIVPGLMVVLRGARRGPVALYGLTLAWTLAFWWVFSHHEPRFLLAYSGLALALLPWALVAVPRPRRSLAVGLVIAATAFSVAVIADQQIVPLGRQPVDRGTFYDRVYGVDPAAEAVPERDGMLVHTGYGLPSIDYVSYYPLLGRSQDRMVALLDADVTRGSTARVARAMRRHRLRYAYVQALPRFRKDVERLFAAPEFRLVHESTIVRGERLGVRRTAYRRATEAETGSGIRRYLFRLVAPGA